MQGNVTALIPLWASHTNFLSKPNCYPMYHLQIPSCWGFEPHQMNLTGVGRNKHSTLNDPFAHIFLGEVLSHCTSLYSEWKLPLCLQLFLGHTLLTQMGPWIAQLVEQGTVVIRLWLEIPYWLKKTHPEPIRAFHILSSIWKHVSSKASSWHGRPCLRCLHFYQKSWMRVRTQLSIQPPANVHPERK